MLSAALFAAALYVVYGAGPAVGAVSSVAFIFALGQVETYVNKFIRLLKDARLHRKKGGVS